MKIKIFVIALTILFVPFSVTHALVTGNVSTDIIGNVNYIFSDGTSGYSYKDSANYTHYQFNNGLYGNCYTDITGATHYYFDQTQTNKYVSGVCHYPTGYTCTEESQYQTMYNNALQGLPSCSNQRTGETGSFSVPAESCTTEGREQLIMSGTYGPYLKTCREHIELYKSAKATYDKCLQDEEEKYKKYAQAKLDLLKQQTDIQRQKIELQNKILESTKKTCPTKSTLNKYGICICEVGLVMNKQNTGCFTCEQLNPESFTQIYGQLTACTTCNDGYYLDKVNKTCVKIINTKTDIPKIEIKNTEIKKPVENNTSIIKDAPKKQTKEIITNTTTTIDTPISENPKIDSKPTIEEPKKVGTFQKAGEKVDSATRGISGFFRKILIKIKFW